jgi:hypothetical protein
MKNFDLALCGIALDKSLQYLGEFETKFKNI